MSPQTGLDVGSSTSSDGHADWHPPVLGVAEEIKKLLENERIVRKFAREGLQHAAAEIVSNGNSMIETLQKVHDRYSQSLEELEQCKFKWTQATTKRTHDLRELDTKFQESRNAKEQNLRDLDSRIQDSQEMVEAANKEVERLTREAQTANADIATAKKQRLEIEEENRTRETELADLAQTIELREAQLLRDQEAVAEDKRLNENTGVSLRDQRLKLFSIVSASGFSTASDTVPAASVTDLELRVTSIVKRCATLANINTHIQDSLLKQQELLSKEQGYAEQLLGKLDEKSREFDVLKTTHTDQIRDLESARRQLSASEERRNSLSDELVSAKLLYQNLETERQNCRNDLFKSQQENEMLHSSAQNDMDAFLLEQSKALRLEARVAKMEKDSANMVEQWKTQKATLLEYQSAIFKAKLDYKNLQLAKEDLQKEVGALAAENEEIPILKSKVAHLEQNLQHERSEHAKHRGYLEDILKHARHHEARCTVAEAEVAQKQSKVEQLQEAARVSDTERIGLKAEVNSKRILHDRQTRQIKELEAQNRILHTKITDREVDREVLHGTQERNESLEDQLLAKSAELQTRENEERVLQARSQTLETANASLKRELEHQQETANRWSQERRSLQKDLGDWRTLANKAEQAKRVVERAKAAVEEELRDTSKKCDSFSLRLDEYKDNIQKTTAEIRTVTTARDELLKQRGLLIKARDGLTTERQELLTSLSQSNTQAHAYKMERDELRKELDRLIGQGATSDQIIESATGETPIARSRGRKRVRPDIRDDESAAPTSTRHERGVGDPRSGDQSLDTPAHRWAIEDVRDLDFRADPVPARVMEQLRHQIELWDGLRSDWSNGTIDGIPRCAQAHAKRKRTLWRTDDKHACTQCVQSDRICVAVVNGHIEILPVEREEDRSLLGPGDVAFWWNG